jgi:hypothetical protein
MSAVLSREDFRALLGKMPGGHEYGALADHDAGLREQRDALLAACEATLLFHAGGEWTAQRAARWLELTGSNDATTKALYDFARRVLAKAGAQ